MTDKQLLKRINEICNQIKVFNCCAEYPPELLHETLTAMTAWQGLTVDWNCFNDPCPLYSRGAKGMEN